MPTVSVKLPESTKQRIDRLAASKGTSPHALMVGAIEAELDRQEKHDSFVQDALRSLEETKATGKAYEGDDVLAYLQARARGETAKRPKLKSVKSMLKSGR